MKILETDSNPVLTNEISTIMNSAGSDKQSDHNYAHAYSHFLSKLPSLENINFLEIGIANIEPDRSSLHGWSRIFKDGNIYGIDIVPEKMINTDRIKTFVANQSSILDLSNFRQAAGCPKFDVILDDGSHIFSDAIVSFKYLINSLKESGMYMIEDIRKNGVDIQQTVVQWEEHLRLYDGIEYEIIDCKPEEQNDDSVIIGIWKI
jgi:hypothetical protein